MILSKNFTLTELISSETALRKGIDNNPPTAVINHLKNLVENVLQPLRDKYGKPINITSGYRSPSLNKTIGGSTSSQHCFGQAADFTVPKEDAKQVFEILKSMQFDQLIWEFGNDHSPQWFHVSFNAQRNRKEILRAYKNMLGQTKYKPI
jgi:zinc D-Ala-D-Ala carboxypeptidase